MTTPQMTTPQIRDQRERRILDVLMALQPGEVTTYGDIAEVAGYPKLSRLLSPIKRSLGGGWLIALAASSQATSTSSQRYSETKT
jgi:alkylated DNA nucleotide flippase Atl1